MADSTSINSGLGRFTSGPPPRWQPCKRTVAKWCPRPSALGIGKKEKQLSATKGYIYAELTVTNPEYFYSEYMSRVTPVLEKYDAKFLVAGGNPEVLEGDRVVKRVVFLEFSSPQRAREFYHSEEYQEVIKHRFLSANTHLYLLDGVPGKA
jgi:uncharacterized protein (DUF1330 family)